MNNLNLNPGAHRSPDRRTFVRSIAGAALVPGLLGAQEAKPPGTVEARTKYGKLRGLRSGDVLSFRGVPYAGPVTGSGRFKPAPKLKAWSGVRDALDYGPQSVQPPDPNMRLKNPPKFSGEENCQFLNIWTKGLRGGAGRPVMFYSHGGGFTTGNGGGIHDGTDLARDYDVVVVTHNHRLGMLGYLYLEELAGEEYAGSGNAGMLDIVAALEWVRDNIEAFGGDPDNVMIWGESGGGAKVATLLAMPAAHGLFHKASVESGSFLRRMTREDATERAHETLDALGLSEKETGKLATVPVERLIDGQTSLAAKNGGLRNFAPVVDGQVLPRHPFDPVAPEISARIPMIVGSNKDESVFMLMNSDPEAFRLDEEGLRKRLDEKFGEKTGRVLAAYKRSRPDASPSDLFIAITTAEVFGADAITMTERKVKQNAAPVFHYIFAYESEAKRNEARVPMKAMHAMEIPFKFNHPEDYPMTGQRPERIQAARNMSAAWAAFARTSNPSHDGIPDWPVYTLDRRATMILDTECKVVDDPYREERLIWQDLRG